MDFSAFLNIVITMFCILIVGYLLGKRDIISSTASKNLSRLIISVGQPALIINSIISKPFSNESLLLSLQSLGFGFAMHGLMALIAYFVCIKLKNEDERKITEFATVFGNIGFLGIPVLGALFPENGAFVASFFVVSFNILLWIIGIAIIARGRDDIKLTFKKALINKGTVPSVIGYIIFLIPAFWEGFALPDFAAKSVSYLASLCTPISMLIIGALLSTIKLSRIFASPKVFYLCFIKLLAIPVIFCFTASILGLPYDWVMFITAVSAMPSASSVSMFAELYDTAPHYSAQCVGTTTLLSVATMPLIIKLADFITTLNISIF